MVQDFPEINYSNITKSLDYYDDAGFVEVSLPWTVPGYICNATLGAQKYYHTESVLVGSAEQSFLYLAVNGKLSELQYYIGVTPCFRDEPVLDETHFGYFMKSELFVYQMNSSHSLEADLHSIINKSLRVFIDRFRGRSVELVKTEMGFDIEMNGVEIGSYGIRKYDNIEWVYGTGLAEPRFTYAMNKAGIFA